MKPALKNIFLTAVLLAALLVSSCSQKKNTIVTRTYHNLTAHYNGYYWARVNEGEAIDNIERAHEDDFSKILPVYKYGDEKTAKANYQKLDKAIEKTSLVIQRHSLFIKGVEHCRWIDENYMVLGIAHFYKRDYFAAIETFEYVIKTFKDNPTRFQAMIWLIRTYNQMNTVINTEPVMALIENDKTFPKKLERNYAVAKADYFVRTERYSAAIGQLQKAIALTHAKKVRARYYFILAQIYEMQGSMMRASEHYAQCAKLHPEYVMEFNARINRAKTFVGKNAEDRKKIKKELEKMVRDEKNIDYRDQIYYALAEMETKEGNEKQAIRDFQLSASSSTKNTTQRSFAYLRLGDIYFDKTDYKKAQSYYDSTMQFLPKDYRDYNLVQNKKSSLTTLVKYINTISSEDSLQRVARMDTTARNKMIDAMIQKLIEDEKRKEEEKQLKPATNVFTNQNNSSSGSSGTTTGAWYFYNPQAISFGLNDFFKKWGNRELSDNWRRSIKEQQVTEGGNEVTENKDTTKSVSAKDVKKTREYYLKNLPLTDDAVLKSNEKIVDAYYNLGIIYKEQLQNYDRSIEAFEALNKRFPDNKYLISSYYFLYRDNLAAKNSKQAEFYKNLILAKFPETEYARILKNPNYAADLQASKSAIEKFYTETYDSYHEGRYDDVIANAERADSLYSKNDLLPKFELLRAMAVGKTRGAKEFENALNRVIIKYPKDEARKKAQELLDQLNLLKKNGTATDTVQRPLYNYNKDAAFIVAVLVTDPKANIDKLKIAISDFNSQSYSLDMLNIASLVWNTNDESQVITVKSFLGTQKATGYYNDLKENKTVFKGLNAADYKIFFISSENYSVLYKEKKLDDYLKFFTENYFKKENKN